MRRTASHIDLLEWLGEARSAEVVNILAVVVEFDADRETSFHFTRSFPAFERFLRGMLYDRKPLEASSTLLVDTVNVEEREALGAFLTAFPGEALRIAGRVVETQYGGNLEATLKNASTPAGN
jgi:hypothetical protein